jgi:hypothetical protein
MRLPHCVTIFYNLRWFCSIKVSNRKLQRNAENTCGNWMCKRAFIDASNATKIEHFTIGVMGRMTLLESIFTIFVIHKMVMKLIQVDEAGVSILHTAALKLTKANHGDIFKNIVKQFVNENGNINIQVW